MSEERVAVTRDLPGAGLERLAGEFDLALWPGDGPPSPEELRAFVAGSVGLLTMHTDRVDATLLDACPSIRVVANLGVGVDNIDVAEMTRRGIPVGNTPGVVTESTADLAFALLLAAARRITESGDALLRGEWTTWRPNAFLGLELSGATLGVVGTGAIGQAVIRRAQGFGMRVIAWSRTRRDLPGVQDVELDELLSSSDVVSLHVALAPETRHLIAARELALMKAGAILINTARGAVVDQPALYEALWSGHLGGAGLDVFEVEPVPLDDPLLGLPNCVVVPHIGSATVATRVAMVDLAVDNLIAGVRGEALVHCVNPEVYGSP